MTVPKELEALTHEERRVLLIFVRRGTLEPSDLPGLTRAERRQVRKRCAKLARIAGHNMEWRKPDAMIQRRLKPRQEPALHASVLRQEVISAEDRRRERRAQGAAVERFKVGRRRRE